MRALLLILVVLAAGVASADDIYLCLNGDETAVVAPGAWSEPTGDCIHETTKDDPRWVAWRAREPTQAQKDAAFNQGARRDPAFRAFLDLYAEREGLTPDELMELLRQKRSAQ